MWGNYLELLHPVERLMNLSQSLDREELTGGEGGLSLVDACDLMDGGERVALMRALRFRQLILDRAVASYESLSGSSFLYTF